MKAGTEVIASKDIRNERRIPFAGSVIHLTKAGTIGKTIDTWVCPDCGQKHILVEFQGDSEMTMVSEDQIRPFRVQ